MLVRGITALGRALALLCLFPLGVSTKEVNLSSPEEAAAQNQSELTWDLMFCPLELYERNVFLQLGVLFQHQEK